MMKDYPRKIRASLIVGNDEWKLWAKRLGRLPNARGEMEYGLYMPDGVYELPVTATDYLQRGGEIHMDQVPDKASVKFRWRTETWS